MLNNSFIDVQHIKNSLRAIVLLCLLVVANLGVVNSAYAQKFTVNFKDADVQELIKFVADSTGKTIVVDPKVKGKIRVVSSQQLNETELYDLFLSVLEINGFAAVDAGGIIRVVPSRQARTQPVPVNSSRASNESFSGYLTQVIQVRNVEASKLIPVLRPLVPPQAHLAAYADSNVIVITDTASNIRRIRQVIERLDNASSEETEVIRLHNASADEAVKTLENLQKAQLTGGKSSRSSSSSLQNQAQLVADLRTNSILVTGPKVARDRIRDLAVRIDRHVDNLGGARVIKLKHAIAKDLVEVLTKVAESNNIKGSRQSVIQADESINAVILSGSADVVQTLAGVIKQLDVERSQVLIEAIIVEVSDDDAKSLGIDWLFLDGDKGFGTTGGSLTPELLAGTAQQDIPSSDGTGSVAGFAALAQTLSGVSNTIFGLGRYREDGTSYIALLNALNNNSEANILSTPSILTMDNHEAEIVVGQEVPFITGSYTNTGGTSDAGNPFQTITRENVGLTLRVTPHISDGGNITMDLEQEVSNVTDSALASDVITNERKIQTSVSTQDGQIIVLGGLVRDEVRENESKVPLLGDIPFIGRFFKTNNTSLTKTNLMVFIRPTIVKTTERLKSISKSRYNDARLDQYRARKDGVDLYDDRVAPILPNYDSQVGGDESIKRMNPGQYRDAQKRYINKRPAMNKQRPKHSSAPAPARVIVRPQQTPAAIDQRDIAIPPSTTPARSTTMQQQGELRFVPPPGFEPVDDQTTPLRQLPKQRDYRDTPKVNSAPTTSSQSMVKPQPQIEERFERRKEPIIGPTQTGEEIKQQSDLDQLYKEIEYQ